MRIVIDTYAWIEIFIGSQKGDRAREILSKAQEAYTPDIVLAEVARKYLREGVEQEKVSERLEKISEASDIAAINGEVALESAKCYMELLARAEKAGARTPSLFDAVILGVARVLKAKLVTSDEHFKDLPETLWLG